MENFEVASSNSFGDNREKIFLDTEVAGGINASQPEVADDVISGYNLDTFRDYYAENLRVASFSSFPVDRNQPLM